MRKFFRILAMVILSGAIVTGTAACSVPEKPEPERSEEAADADQDADLEVWTFYDRNVPGYYYMFLWDDIAKAQGITIDVKNYASDDMESKLELALVTGELPDVFLTPGGTFLDEFVEAGVCAQVDGYVNTLNLTEEYAVPYQDGHYYEIPCMQTDYGVVYYDAYLLSRLGISIPETWDELEQMVQTVNEYNEKNGTSYSAISFGNKDGYEGNLLMDMISISDQVNRDPDQAKDPVMIDQEVLQASADKIVRLNELGAFSEDYMETGDEEAVTNFIRHNSVMLVNRSSILSHLIWNMKEDFYTGLFPGMYNTDGNYRMIRLDGPTRPGLCINSFCDDKELAGALCVEYVKRVNEENLKTGCRTMIRDTDVKAERLLERHIEMNSLLDNAAGTVTAPSAMQNAEIQNMIRSLTKDLYSGQADTEEFMDAMEAVFAPDGE